MMEKNVIWTLEMDYTKECDVNRSVSSILPHIRCTFHNKKSSLYLQYFFCSEIVAGGAGSRAVWNFYKNHPFQRGQSSLREANILWFLRKRLICQRFPKIHQILGLEASLSAKRYWHASNIDLVQLGRGRVKMQMMIFLQRGGGRDYQVMDDDYQLCRLYVESVGRGRSQIVPPTKCSIGPMQCSKCSIGSPTR